MGDGVEEVSSVSSNVILVTALGTLGSSVIIQMCHGATGMGGKTRSQTTERSSRVGPNVSTSVHNQLGF